MPLSLLRQIGLECLISLEKSVPEDMAHRTGVKAKYPTARLKADTSRVQIYTVRLLVSKGWNPSADAQLLLQNSPFYVTSVYPQTTKIIVKFIIWC